jgi:hypothetical protein
MYKYFNVEVSDGFWEHMTNDHAPLSSQQGIPSKTFWGLLPDRQGQNLALTVFSVPYSPDSGQSIRWRVKWSRLTASGST